MNSTQLQTTTASLVAGAAGFAAGHGWLGLDAGTWGAVFGALMIIGTSLWPAVVTRAQALKNATGSLKNTTVVTDPASAAATANKDVVAVTPAIAAAIKASA